MSLRPAIASIVLCTLNARYIHASLGLRYLLANMERHGSAALRECTVLREYTVSRPTQEVLDDLLATLGPPREGAPLILGLGIYIWNVAQSEALLRLLKLRRPDVMVVLGGPEVSHETQEQSITPLADHVITGWGDVSFARLCHALVHGPRPLMKIIAGVQPPLADIALPYAGYSATDLVQRVLYVEASRGCPFKCEFCLSSLDKTAWAFPLEPLLDELKQLHGRGARHFKFVDRTFNLRIDASVRLLEFFLQRLSPDLRLHFEVVPDHLPDRLKAMLVQFPAGVMQLEVGIQSFNQDVQQRVSRRQDNAKTEENLRWLLEHAHAHLHADLIFGLPGETLESFAAGFDRLYAIGPHEIQLGLLKRLRGTPIARHTAAFAMVYDLAPPYAVRQTGAVDEATVQRFVRLARYWDLLANSGRFARSLGLLLQADSPFAAFLDFSDWLWQCTGQTCKLTPETLVDQLFSYLPAQRGLPAQSVRESLLADYLASGARANPKALQGHLPRRAPPGAQGIQTFTPRQRRHATSATPDSTV